MGGSALGLAAAFGAGLISITSPCCLPLLPGYLGYLTGLSAEDMAERRGRTLSAALLFVAGFTVVFVALGATASELGAALAGSRVRLEQVAGVLIAVMGVVLLLDGRIPGLWRAGDWSRLLAGGRMWAAAPLGASFAITWTPCIGPVLGAILALAGSTQDLGRGVVLLAVYSLGLALPFLALSLAVAPARALLRRAAGAMAAARLASGAILVIMGVLLVSGRWLPLIAPALDAYGRLHWPPV